MVKRLAVMVALAACGGGKAKGPAEPAPIAVVTPAPAATPAPAPPAPAPAPTPVPAPAEPTPPAPEPAPTPPPPAPVVPAPKPGPTPKLTWNAADMRFATTRLPAVTADGSGVVIARRDSDGARGAPNLTLIVLDRTDHEADRFVVIEPDDGIALMDKPKELAKRAARGQKWLADLHAKRNLVPLAHLEVERADLQRTARGGGLTVDWVPSTLSVKRASALLHSETTAPSWLTKDSDPCPACEDHMVCHNPAFLDDAWIDAARKIALVQVAYKGTDTCWEPSAQLHVTVW